MIWFNQLPVITEYLSHHKLIMVCHTVKRNLVDRDHTPSLAIFSRLLVEKFSRTQNGLPLVSFTAKLRQYGRVQETLGQKTQVLHPDSTTF